ncbi:hypothetical protein B9Z19DRAFT_1063467 [Tuber borchii]|uniref:Uncharacterized protein n=1 Tax=Tuber borchii TaxID=42251 RepID=A0A2T6ZY67_TUBBO|nr:hypothetical protein B9Z19DRAFT_1063467 [Tuber borchii]
MLEDSVAFQELEARWLNRCPSLRNAMLKVLNESEARSFKRYEETLAGMSDHLAGQEKFLQEGQNELFKHLKARDKRHDKKVKELILRNADLIDALLEERTKRMKLEGKYNVWGALERMVYLAKVEQKVAPRAGIQEGLDKLAKGREFTTALRKEARDRKLSVNDVMASVNHLYVQASKCADDNDDTFRNIIIVRASKFSDNERAALAVFFKIQSNWVNAFKWREDTSLKGDE